jgi:hypothetical protein
MTYFRSLLWLAPLCAAACTVPGESGPADVESSRAAISSPYFLGYQFTHEPDADVVVAELARLQGEWYPAGGAWNSAEPVDHSIVETAVSVELPRYAGLTAVWADDLASAKAGKIRPVPPFSNVVQIGVPLAQYLPDFRPIQFSDKRDPDQAYWTLLYRPGQETIVDAQGTRIRPTLDVIYCPQQFSIGALKPSAESCALAADGSLRTPHKHTHDLFDAR